MEQYIPKSAVVAEIESLKSAAETMLTGKMDLSYWKAQKCLCERFLSFINTLEVKDVNSNDAFIEKACKWFRDIDYDDSIPPFETTEEFMERVL